MLNQLLLATEVPRRRYQIFFLKQELMMPHRSMSSYLSDNVATNDDVGNTRPIRNSLQYRFLRSLTAVSCLANFPFILAFLILKPIPFVGLGCLLLAVNALINAVIYYLWLPRIARQRDLDWISLATFVPSALINAAMVVQQSSSHTALTILGCLLVVAAICFLFSCLLF